MEFVFEPLTVTYGGEVIGLCMARPSFIYPLTSPGVTSLPSSSSSASSSSLSKSVQSLSLLENLEIPIMLQLLVSILDCLQQEYEP